MKFSLTLLILNGILFGLILLLQKSDDSLNPNTGSLSGIISRQVIDADRIKISGPGLKSPRILQRNGSDWFLESPLRWPANYFAVNRILNQLQFLEEEVAFTVEEITQTGQSLADYGLATAALELFIYGQNDPLHLKIGNRTDIGSNIYILGPKGKNIYVISNELIDSLLVHPDELRNRNIFDIPVFEVEALSVHLKGKTESDQSNLKVFLKKTDSDWRFETPLTTEADNALVNNTINTLTALKVGRFVGETGDPTYQGLTNPAMKITLLGNKRQQTLLIGNQYNTTEKTAAYFAKIEGNPTVFTVGAAPIDQLRIAQESLRERNFMSLNKTTLETIDITGIDLEIRLRKLETTGWQIIRSGKQKEVTPHRASEKVIQDLIENLDTLRATGFAYDTPSSNDLDRLGFGNPLLLISIGFQNQNQPLVLELAHPAGDLNNLFARTNRSECIYRIDRKTSLELFSVSDLYYRDRKLETLPQAARITLLTFEDLESNNTLVTVDSENALNKEEILLAKQPKNIQPALQSLLDWVRSVEVANFITDTFVDAYPLNDSESLPWAYRLTAHIELPGGDAESTISRNYVFGKRLSGSSQIGGSDYHQCLFQSPPELIEALDILCRDYDAPPEISGQPVPEIPELVPVPMPDLSSAANQNSSEK